MGHAFLYLSITFLSNLKELVCNSTIYTLKGADLVQFLVISLLVRAHVTVLPFVLFELDNDIMATLNKQKQVPPHLEIVNVDDVSSSSIGRTTTFSVVKQATSFMFGKQSLQPLKRRKRIKVSPTSSARTSKAPRVGNGDEPTGDSTTVGNPASGGTLLKVEEPLEDAVDVEPSRTEGFDKKMKAFYEFLRSAMHKNYCSVYTSQLQDTCQKHNDLFGVYVTEAVNLVLADLP